MGLNQESVVETSSLYCGQWAVDCGLKKMASDKNHRPCLPLKPQEKFLNILN